MMNIKQILTGSVAFLLLASTTSVYARGEATGKVTQAGVYTNNLVAVVLEGGKNKPLCASQQGWFGMSMSDAAAKGIYATILTAHASGAILYVVGTGECTSWPNREDILYAEIR